jgi:hypothetical protein
MAAFCERDNEFLGSIKQGIYHTAVMYKLIKNGLRMEFVGRLTGLSVDLLLSKAPKMNYM